MSIRNLQSSKKCCGLKIPGTVPKTYCSTDKHVEFLNFVDNLVNHPMFRNRVFKYHHKFDNQNFKDKMFIHKKRNQVAEDRHTVTYKDNLLSHEQIVCYTDGSAELNKAAGAGVCFVNKHIWNLEDVSISVPGEQTNIRAELFAILTAITTTAHLAHLKLTIRTDSL